MQKVVHFEIPADDIERAKKFYGDIFGWQLQDWPLQDGSVYTGARTVEVDETTFIPKEPGAINGGIVKRDEYVKTPQVTVNVPSIDDYVMKIKAAGGSVVREKQEIEGAGYYAYVNDSEGNLLGLWEDVKKL
jgi:predicted enzyme related to lactoylglutathione lyase